MVRLCGPSVTKWRDRSIYRKPASPSYCYSYQLPFHQTLGFPGEGPFADGLGLGLPYLLQLSLLISLFITLPQWLAHVLARRPILLLIALTSRSHLHVCAMPITARNAADRQRAAVRSGRLPLSEGRHVTAVTRTMRQGLLASFLQWVQEEQIPWSEMMENSHNCLEDINAVLIAFGRILHKSGRPYQHFAETINAVANTKLTLKRHLQGAWSLAFSWLQNEPSTHHVAMPFQVLMAILTTTMLWGWWNVGGLLSLG